MAAVLKIFKIRVYVFSGLSLKVLGRGVQHASETDLNCTGLEHTAVRYNELLNCAKSLLPKISQ